MSDYQWTTQDYLYVAAECVTGVLSALGNGLVLLAIFKTRALRTITNCFIGSLAAADVLVGLVLPPAVILPYRQLPDNFYGCVLVNTIVVLITNISILNLLAVALERYLAISDPFRYQRLMTMTKAMLVVAVTWVMAILIGLVPMMGWNLGEEGFDGCAFTKVIDMKYMVYLIFFGVNLPLLLFMLLIYIYIFHIVRKQQRMVAQLTVLSREERHHAHQRKREVRGAKGLAYVIILFAACWMPLHILNSVTLFAPQHEAPYRVLLVAIVLSHANSFVNPFLYAFSNSKIKTVMMRILFCGHLKHCYSTDSDEKDSRVANSRQSQQAEGRHIPAANSDKNNAATGTKVCDNHSPFIISQHMNKKDSEKSHFPARSCVLGNKAAGVLNSAFNEVDTSTTADKEEEMAQPQNESQERRSVRRSEGVVAIPVVHCDHIS